MSLEYKLFLCQKPLLDTLIGGDDDDDLFWIRELERDGDTWHLGGITLSICEYHPHKNDEIDGQPWRD